VEYLTSAALVAFLVHRVRLRFPWSRLGRTMLAGGVVVLAAWPLRGLPAAPLAVAVAALYALSAAAVGAMTGDDLRALANRRLGLGATQEAATPRP
jgi:hypothetical protein